MLITAVTMVVSSGAEVDLADKRLVNFEHGSLLAPEASTLMPQATWTAWQLELLGHCSMMRVHKLRSKLVDSFI